MILSSPDCTDTMVCSDCWQSRKGVIEEGGSFQKKARSVEDGASWRVRNRTALRLVRGFGAMSKQRAARCTVHNHRAERRGVVALLRPKSYPKNRIPIPKGVQSDQKTDLRPLRRPQDFGLFQASLALNPSAKKRG